MLGPRATTVMHTGKYQPVAFAVNAQTGVTSPSATNDTHAQNPALSKTYFAVSGNNGARQTCVQVRSVCAETLRSTHQSRIPPEASHTKPHNQSPLTKPCTQAMQYVPARRCHVGRPGQQATGPTHLSIGSSKAAPQRHTAHQRYGLRAKTAADTNCTSCRAAGARPACATAVSAMNVPCGC